MQAQVIYMNMLLKGLVHVKKHLKIRYKSYENIDLKASLDDGCVIRMNLKNFLQND